MKPLELVAEAMEARFESVIFDECPKCLGKGEAAGMLEGGTIHIAIVHRSWCPANDVNLPKLLKRAKATMGNVPIIDHSAEITKFVPVILFDDKIGIPINEGSRLYGRVVLTEPDDEGMRMLELLPEP